MRSEKLEKEMQEKGEKNCSTCGNGEGCIDVFKCAGCNPETFKKWIPKQSKDVIG